MLGFHADGIRLFGASDTLIAALKKRKLPLRNTSTGNTLVFAVNTADVLTKKLYAPSFLAPMAPWFSCTVGDFPRPAPYTLAFAACFCFLEGGFMESDRLFGKLTKEYGVGADKILLAGAFDSKYQFLRAFVPQK